MFYFIAIRSHLTHDQGPECVVAFYQIQICIQDSVSNSVDSDVVFGCV